MQPSFFRTTNYEAFKNVNPKRVSNTCQWVLTHPYYTHWRDDPKANVLWISADPGCGKSTLAKALIDEDLINSTNNQKSQDKFQIIYFFFKDIGEQSHATSALCALLHQLYSNRARWVECFRDVKALTDVEGEALKTNFTALWSLLLKSVSQKSKSKKTESKIPDTIVCVLDALDECRTTERGLIVEKLESLANNQSDKSRIKFLVTSRPYQHIVYDFRPMVTRIPSIHLAGENESDKLRIEINVVIQRRIQEIGQRILLSSFIVHTLIKKLESMQQRTYLWLGFMLDELQNLVGPTDKELLQQIAELPVTVEDAYERILSRSRRPNLARTLLSLVTIAKRPLLLEELELLVKTSTRCHRKEDLDLSGPTRFKEVARDACGLFLTVIDGKVFLMHQTAKEFLMSREEVSGNSAVWKGSIDAASAHLDIGNRCMSSLSLQDISLKDPCVQYSLHEWQTHVRKAGSGTTNLLIPSFQILSRQALDTNFSKRMLETYYEKVTHNSSCSIEDTAPRKLLENHDDQKVGRYSGSKSYKALQIVEEALRSTSQSPQCYGSPAILLASAYSLDMVFDLILKESTDVHVKSGSYLDIAFDVAVLYHNLHQIRSVLSKYPLSSFHPCFDAGKCLRYALPEKGIVASCEALSLLVDAGLRIDGKSQRSKPLARIQDLRLLFRAGLQPLNGYLPNLVETVNQAVILAIIEEDELWYQCIAATCTGRPAESSETCFSTELHKERFINAFLEALSRQYWQFAPLPAILLRRIAPEAGKLCLWCYAFCFQRQPVLQRIIATIRRIAPFNPVHFCSLQSAKLSCNGLGPQAIAAYYDRTTNGDGIIFALDHTRAHPKITTTLRWSAFLAALHDNSRYLETIANYALSRRINLSLGTNGQILPKLLITACEERKGTGVLDLTNADLLLKWTLEVALALIDATNVEVVPRSIFDDEALTKVAKCIQYGADPQLIHRFAAYVEKRIPFDERYVILEEHLRNLIDCLLQAKHLHLGNY